MKKIIVLILVSVLFSSTVYGLEGGDQSEEYVSNEYSHSSLKGYLSVYPSLNQMTCSFENIGKTPVNFDRSKHYAIDEDGSLYLITPEYIAMYSMTLNPKESLTVNFKDLPEPLKRIKGYYVVFRDDSRITFGHDPSLWGRAMTWGKGKVHSWVEEMKTPTATTTAQPKAKATAQAKKSAAKDVLESEEFLQAMKGMVASYKAAHKEYVDSIKLMESKANSLSDKADKLTETLSENLSTDDMIAIPAIQGQALISSILLQGVVNVLVLNSVGEGHPTENGKEVFAGLIVRDLQESVYYLNVSITMVESLASGIKDPEAKKIAQEIIEDIKEGGGNAYFWADHFSEQPHAEQEKAIPDSL